MSDPKKTDPWKYIRGYIVNNGKGYMKPVALELLDILEKESKKCDCECHTVPTNYSCHKCQAKHYTPNPSP